MAGEELYTLMISEELTVESLIRDIVAKEGLDPWDIDLVALTNKFLDAIHHMQKVDVKISGKFLLAAAILLKMKSDYLLHVEEEKTLTSPEIDPALLEANNVKLEPNLPLPKKRKITIEELLSSLQKALAVKERRIIRHKEKDIDFKIKVKRVNIGEKIKLLFKRLLELFETFGDHEIKFSSLVPSNFKMDIIWTFVPLIHIANKGHVILKQEEDFGEIYVSKPGKSSEQQAGKESFD